MQTLVRAMCLPAVLLFASAMMGSPKQDLSACNSRTVKRQGNHISIPLDALGEDLNRRLKAAHSHFSDLKLTSEGGNDLKVSGKKNGNAISIAGPLKTTADGQLLLHANRIHKNGAGVEGIMSLFGKNLSDYVNLKKTKSMTVQGNNLKINPDKLLGLRSRATDVKVAKSSVEIQFASQPCN